MKILTANIWKIDRFAIHDGPGIRTNFYFKGCPLRCLWCSNPEGQRGTSEFAFLETRCTGCGECLDICPEGAIRIESQNALVDFTKCSSCGDTTEKTLAPERIPKLENELESQQCAKCKNQSLQVLQTLDLIEELGEVTKETSAEIEIISPETEEGRQLLTSFRGIGAILRWAEHT